MKERLTIELDNNNLEKAREFFKIYEYESHINTGLLESTTYLGEKKSRKCRFCGKYKGETFFKKKAHTIPQFLGNKYLLSAFECDQCNELFGKLYEDSFANYLGPYRPFSFVAKSSNKKFPKHKETALFENQQKLRLSIQQADNKRVEIIYEYPFNDAVTFEKDKQILKINAIRQPYIPIYVYKMLLKIGVSMIKEEEIDYFEGAINFLLDNKQNEKFKDSGLLRVYIHAIYGPPMFPFPAIYLYKKKKEFERELYLNKCFILYTSNRIYQIFIPYNKQDFDLIGQTITIYPYPLLFDKTFYEKGIKYESYSELLTGHEKIYGEKHQLLFSYESAQFHQP